MTSEQLPPLPEPFMELHREISPHVYAAWAEQMRAYAAAAIAEERDACARVRQDAERYKASASMWRNKAYELGGTPLPWDADEMLEKAVRAERDACARACDAVAESANKAAVAGQYLVVRNGAEARRCSAAIRARGTPPCPDCHTQGICQRSGYGIPKP
jgi:hypothetical protein